MSISEADVCDQFITPAIQRAGWDKTSQIRREVTFTDGQVQVRGKISVRGKRKRADYLLYFQPNLPLAVIEAKVGYKIHSLFPLVRRVASFHEINF